MNGSDVVTGSRYLSQRPEHRSFMRFACSKAYNLLVRVLSSPIGITSVGSRRSAGMSSGGPPTVRSNHCSGHRVPRARTKLGFRVTEVRMRLVRIEDGTTVGCGTTSRTSCGKSFPWKEFRSQKAS